MTEKFKVRIPTIDELADPTDLGEGVVIQNKNHHHSIYVYLKPLKELANKANPLDYLLTQPSIESEGMRFVPEGQRYNFIPSGRQGKRGPQNLYVAQVGDEVVFTHTSVLKGGKLSGVLQMHCSQDEFLDLLAEVRAL